MDKSPLQDAPNDCIRVYPDRVQIQQCIEKIHRVEPTLARLAQVMDMAGSEPRLKILYLLEEETGLCVCDLSDVLGMSIPAISQHLRKLRDAQVIQARRVGQTVYYSLQQEASTLLAPILAQIEASNREVVSKEP